MSRLHPEIQAAVLLIRAQQPERIDPVRMLELAELCRSKGDYFSLGAACECADIVLREHDSDE